MAVSKTVSNLSESIAPEHCVLITKEDYEKILEAIGGASQNPIFAGYKDQTFVVLSQFEYNGLLASFDLSSIPGFYESVLEAENSDEWFTRDEVFGDCTN